MIYKAHIDLTFKVDTDTLYFDTFDQEKLVEFIGDSVIDGDMDLFSDVNVDVKNLEEMEI